MDNTNQGHQQKSFYTNSTFLFRIISILLFCFACSSLSPDSTALAMAESLVKHPLSMPEFILHLDPPSKSEQSSDKICANVVDGLFWESRDTEDKLLESFMDRIQLVVDGQKLAIDRDTVLSYGGITVNTDANGKFLSSNWKMNLCWNANLWKGLHLATIQLRSTSGQPHEYSW